MRAFISHNIFFTRQIRTNILTGVIGLLLTFLLTSQPLSAKETSSFDTLPLPVKVVLTKINSKLQEKDYTSAIEILLAFQKRGGEKPQPGQPDPKGYHHPEIYYTLGNCYLLQEKYDQAIAAYRKAVARDKTHTYCWLNLAKSYYEMNQYAEAGNAFLKAYESTEEKNPEDLYFSAAAYLMAENHLQSIQIFEQLFTTHPKAIKPLWKEHFVHALLGADQPRRALPYIHELTRIYTGDKQIQWQEILLHQYMQLDMRKEALDYAHLLTRNTPTVAKWWKAMVHIQLNNSEFEEALAALTIYSFLIPLSTEEKKLLADLNLQLGVPVNAIPQYETVLKEKPDKEILQHLVVAYRQVGRAETAIKLLDQSELTLSDDELILLKGELLYTLKDYANAAATYRKAAQGKGDNAGRAWLMAGYAAWQTNDISASKEAFEKATAFKKEKKAATTALKQLASLTVKKSMNDQKQEEPSNDRTSQPEI